MIIYKTSVFKVEHTELYTCLSLVTDAQFVDPDQGAALGGLCREERA